MDKNLFFALGLSMAVILLYYSLLAPPPAPPARSSADHPPSAAPSLQQTSQNPSLRAAPAAEDPTTGAATTETVTAAPSLPSTDRDAVAQAEPIEVSTPHYKLTLSPLGGTMQRFVLQDYRQGKQQSGWGDLIPPLGALLAATPQPDANQPVQLLGAQLPGRPTLSVGVLGDAELQRALDSALFQADQQTLTLSAGEQATLTLRAELDHGLAIHKILTFHADSYVIDYTLKVINYGAQAHALTLSQRFGSGPPDREADTRSHIGPIFQLEGSVDTVDADDIGPELALPRYDWMGITSDYFLNVVHSTTPYQQGIYHAANLAGGQEDELWRADFAVVLPPFALQPNKQVAAAFTLYLGPKRIEDMQTFGHQLENALDLSLDVLASPMLALLRWFHRYVANYGVAIILLTVVVRLVLFPLTYKSMLTMKRMQKLQPRMLAIREKFKNQKEKMNREVMELYRRQKVNPLGGCLPIALQIPIFFALYSALLGAIELRHSPFVFWITDLSVHDPLFILPLLMGGSMFLQQRLTPTTVDPTQARILKWLPVIFTAFMLQFPAGLVLYWLVSNLLSILQQLVINRVNIQLSE